MNIETIKQWLASMDVATIVGAAIIAVATVIAATVVRFLERTASLEQGYGESNGNNTSKHIIAYNA